MTAMTMTCHTPGCSTTVPHPRTHLFVGKRIIGMRVTRQQATVFMADGTLIGRRQPGAVSLLKRDVRAYLARLANHSQAESGRGASAAGASTPPPSTPPACAHEVRS